MTRQSAHADLERPHLKIWAIAGPAILANSSAPLVGLVDTWAIGHLPGAVHLAAVGLGSVIFNYILWAFGFLRMGTTGLIAQAKGREDLKEQVVVGLRSATLGLLLGLLIFAFQTPLLELAYQVMAPPAEVAEITTQYYDIRIFAVPFSLLSYTLLGVLFGLGKTTAILLLQLFLNLSNGALNVLFVVGLGWGVPGVAWGTLIAQALTALAGIWVLLRIFGLREVLLSIRDRATWVLVQFKTLLLVNGFIFVRSLLLMTALALIMREAAQLGAVEMAASHVVTQYMLLTALGLDGFAHASEALAGAAWGRRDRVEFRRWVKLTGLWSIVASLFYMGGFWGLGDLITGMLTDIESVEATVKSLMPLVVALPLISVWSFLFDGVYIGATAASAMMFTMAAAFVAYLVALAPLTQAWGLFGLWAAVLVFNAARGLTQAIYYPFLERRLSESRG